MTGKRIGLVQELAIVHSGCQADSGYRVNQNGMKIPGMASFSCKDIGINCPFETQAATDQELMRRFIDHAGSAHDMQVLSADIIFKMQKAIKK